MKILASLVVLIFAASFGFAANNTALVIRQSEKVVVKQQRSSLRDRLFNRRVKEVKQVERIKVITPVQKVSVNKFVVPVQKVSVNKFVVPVQKVSFNKFVVPVQKVSFNKFVAPVQKVKFNKFVVQEQVYYPQQYVAYEFSQAYQSVTPIVAETIKYEAPVCEEVVQQPVVCVQKVLAPVYVPYQQQKIVVYRSPFTAVQVGY